MKHIGEFVRAVLVSPEVLIGALPFAISSYWPEPANFASEIVMSDTKWTLGMGIILLVGTYGLAWDVLSPSESKKAILSWPDYWKLKMRIYVALGYCIVGIILIMAGVYMIAHEIILWGATIAISGILCGATALATVAIARLTIREICSE